MKFKCLKTSSLVAIAVLFALTAYLFAFNRIRRRERVPAMTITLPQQTNRSRVPMVAGLAFAPKSDLLAIVDWYSRFYLADPKNGNLRKMTSSLPVSMNGSLSWNRDGKKVLSVRNGSVNWLDLESMKGQQFVASWPSENRVATSAVSSSGRFLLTTSGRWEHFPKEPWKNGSLVFSDIASKRSLWSIELKPDDQGLSPLVCNISISPNEQVIAISTLYYGSETPGSERAENLDAAAKNEALMTIKKSSVVLRSARNGKVIRQLARPESGSVNFFGEMMTARFSPDQKVLAVSYRNEVVLYSLHDGSVIATVAKRSCFATPLAFSPNGRLLAVGGTAAPLEIWSVPNKRLLQTFRAKANNLSFSADGKWLASDDDKAQGQVKIWEVGSLN